MKNPIKLRSNLQELLEERRMSLRELAKRTDYRFESIRQLARGELTRIPVDLIERICTELNCDISDLFKVTPEARKNPPNE